MRIGDVNKDNYKQFQQLLGINNTKANDGVVIDSGTSKTDPFGNERVLGSDGYETAESINQRMIKLGYIEEGMYIKEGEIPNHRIVAVTDSVRDRIIETVRKHIIANPNGTMPQELGDELGAIYKEYRQNIDPKDRQAVTWSLSQIASNESKRIYDYVKSQIPNYQYGEWFDPNILTNSNFGLNHIDTKA